MLHGAGISAALVDVGGVRVASVGRGKAFTCAASKVGHVTSSLISGSREIKSMLNVSS